MRNKLAVLLFAAGLVSLGSVALADFNQTFTGSNAGGPLWMRPIDDGPTVRTDPVHYQQQRFRLESAATCKIYSAQEFDGYIHLYQSPFDPNNPLSNLIGGDDDGEMGIGTSRLPDPADTTEPTLNLAAGNYVLVTSGFAEAGQGAFWNTIHCDATQPTHGTCASALAPREKQTCHHNRFAVRIVNISNHPTDGIAVPARLGSSDSAFFWFYSDQNFEVMVKVLDACIINDRYWVFAGALTNQRYEIRVLDTQTGFVNIYSNPLGNRADAVADTDAFDCTP
ncbi:MAG TPA: hypothetical protein VF017_05545 [Thermoanaerobaculia bacterium]|nr:hypothetical protein [Thermoanaerobaculia bacterium]